MLIYNQCANHNREISEKRSHEDCEEDKEAVLTVEQTLNYDNERKIKKSSRSSKRKKVKLKRNDKGNIENINVVNNYKSMPIKQRTSNNVKKQRKIANLRTISPTQKQEKIDNII